MSSLHVVVPDGIDDPARASGGNVYDRRVCQELRSLGWAVLEHPVGPGWPARADPSLAALAAVVDALPDAATVLIDGIVASVADDVLLPHAARLRIVVLVHLPLEGGRERRVLAAAAGVVATSAWTRDRLLLVHGLDPARTHVVRPGVDPAERALRTPAGSSLLCVGAVTRTKGQDVLVEALGKVTDLRWTCLCVGSLDRDPPLVAAVRRRAQQLGLGDRLRLVGPVCGTTLEAHYAAADLLVVASRAETYGMVVTEALARAVPVLATDAGGIPEALGRAPGGRTPGILVRPDDVPGLADALRSWLTDSRLRDELRRRASGRRDDLQPWTETAGRLAVAVMGEDGDRSVTRSGPPGATR